MQELKIYTMQLKTNKMVAFQDLIFWKTHSTTQQTTSKFWNMKMKIKQWFKTSLKANAKQNEIKNKSANIYCAFLYFIFKIGFFFFVENINHKQTHHINNRSKGKCYDSFEKT